MNKVKMLIAACAFLLAPSIVSAQEAETITSQTIPGTNIKKYTVAWTASATATKTATTILGMNEFLFYVVTDPGSTAPAEGYSIIMTDATGLDVMGVEGGVGPLTSLSTDTTQDWIPKISQKAYGARFVDGTLTINYTDMATADAEGEIFLYTIMP